MTKKELSFEACMQRLDAIVQQMEEWRYQPGRIPEAF